MIKFFYSDKYYLKWGEHVFPVEKFKLVYQKIKEHYGPAYIAYSSKISEEKILLVHTPQYLERVKQLTKTPEAGYYEFEVPISEEVLESLYYAVGGTVEAIKFAIEKQGCGFNIGGGFHHAHADRGGGFCIFNDIAVAIKTAQKEYPKIRIAVVDCDLHQGDGTATIFENDYTVFTFSIHQENLYPPKQHSNLDIGLDDFTGDEEYLKKLQEGLQIIEDKFLPQVIVYQAGADPYEKDQLGSLKITKDGLKKRDEMVISWAKKMACPLVVTLGGGYPPDINDVVEIHFNTAQVAFNFYKD